MVILRVTDAGMYLYERVSAGDVPAVDGGSQATEDQACCQEIIIKGPGRIEDDGTGMQKRVISGGAGWHSSRPGNRDRSGARRPRVRVGFRSPPDIDHPAVHVYIDNSPSVGQRLQAVIQVLDRGAQYGNDPVHRGQYALNIYDRARGFGPYIAQ